MDKFTLTFVLTAGLVVVLGVLWFTWKYHYELFKYFLVGFIFFAVVLVSFIYRMRPVEPKRDPAVGKHAYMRQTGEYLGVVEGSGRDRQRGDVWIVRPPGGYQLMYGKSRVTLRDVDDMGNKEKAEPSPSPSPK
jgi:membrane protein implicated in regulation of membrane protease activity